jgi:hypothetical protein
MNILEEQLVMADDSNFRKSHDLSKAFRIQYNQNIKEFFGKNVIAFQREIIEISGKISLLPGEDKSISIYNTEVETLSKMNGNFKKLVDDLIINLDD